MKLGVLGYLPRSLAELDAARILEIRELGFTGTGLPAADDPAAISDERAREVGRMFADAGVDLVEYGRYGSTLVDPDPAVRKQNVDSLRQALRVARAAGCEAVITGAGSLNPKSPWFPHPENHAPATYDRLVSTLRELAPIAEDEGVILGLECHVTTALKDAPTARRVVDDAGSKLVKVHLDPVNWMSFETVYRSGEAVASMFEALGPERMLGAHSKGVAVEDRLIVHMSETVTGAPDDLFDHAALLRQVAKMSPNTYLVIEHLTPAQVPAARDHLLRIAEQVGVKFDR